MIKEQLYKLIYEEKYLDALSLIAGYFPINSDIDSEFCILCATVCQNLRQYKEMYLWIQTGLNIEYNNYELYLLLGIYYETINPNQAYLCYENALYYCNDEDDLFVIKEYINNLSKNNQIIIEKTSIIILSYNSLEMTRQCIESIRNTTPSSSYELIVIDNCSTDNSVEYLKTLEDIKLICNKENIGFPKGCNQGIGIASPNNNIFLLNNDTIVMPNSIFWLRMGLYENCDVGSVGSITNCAINGQQIDRTFNSIDEYKNFAIKTNIPSLNPYENKTWLVGFALLIKRSALSKVGLLDEEFSPGCFEDNDIGVRLQLAGFKSYLCHNSFIFHYGNGGGENSTLWNDVKDKNSSYFKQKWGFDLSYYSYPRYDVIELIEDNPDGAINVLDIGCGCGTTLDTIKYKWPNASVHGIEIVEKIAELGSKHLDIICQNIEELKLPYEKNQFDYIMLCDVLEHLHNPADTLLYLKNFLKDNGKILCSIPNLMHISVIGPLLRGSFEYQDSGILDKTHIHFFTLDSIIEIANSCGYSIQKIWGKPNDNIVASIDNTILKELQNLSHIAPAENFSVYQYILSLQKA